MNKRDEGKEYKITPKERETVGWKFPRIRYFGSRP